MSGYMLMLVESVEVETRAHTPTHTHTHPHIRAYTYPHTHTHIHICTHAHTRLHTNTYKHTLTDKYAQNPLWIAKRAIFVHHANRLLWGSLCNQSRRLRVNVNRSAFHRSCTMPIEIDIIGGKHAFWKNHK